MADKGYHAAETLELARGLGFRTYIPEPQKVHASRWTDKPAAQQKAVYANRRRARRAKCRKLQRLRSERFERTFAHVCDSCGTRRSWLRGLANISKCYLLAAAARNLGHILFKLLGVGKPKSLQGERLFAALAQLRRIGRRACLMILTALEATYRLAPNYKSAAS